MPRLREPKKKGHKGGIGNVTAGTRGRCSYCYTNVVAVKIKGKRGLKVYNIVGDGRSTTRIHGGRLAIVRKEKSEPFGNIDHHLSNAELEELEFTDSGLLLERHSAVCKWTRTKGFRINWSRYQL